MLFGQFHSNQTHQGLLRRDTCWRIREYRSPSLSQSTMKHFLFFSKVHIRSHFDACSASMTIPLTSVPSPPSRTYRGENCIFVHDSRTLIKHLFLRILHFLVHAPRLLHIPRSRHIPIRPKSHKYLAVTQSNERARFIGMREESMIPCSHYEFRLKITQFSAYTSMPLTLSVTCAFAKRISKSTRENTA